MPEAPGIAAVPATGSTTFTASHTNWSTPSTYADRLTRLDVFKLEGPDEQVVYDELNDDTQLCGGSM